MLSIFQGERVFVDPVIIRELEIGGLHRELKIRKYSKNTITAYIHYVEDLRKITNKPLRMISNDDIKDYLLYLVDKKQASTSSVNSAINALKFYYGGILHREFHRSDIRHCLESIEGILEGI